MLKSTIKKIHFFIILSTLLIIQNALSQNSCELLLQSQKQINSFSKIEKLSDKKTLTLMTFNTLNLNYTVGKHYKSPWETPKEIKRKKLNERKKKSGKPEWAINGLAKIILENSPDVISLQEVESIPSARNFNKKKLGDQYKIFSTPGNDKRGIQLVFLVKKTLIPFLQFSVKSFANETWVDPTKNHNQSTKLFSRDLLTLEARLIEATEDSKPLFTIFSTHLKSKRDRNHDKQSTILREAQINRTVKIIHQYLRKYGQDLLYFEMGDHNSSFNFESEWTNFYRSSYLVNTLNFSSKSKNLNGRVTHTFHPGGKKINRYQELDTIFISKNSQQHVIDSQVIPYKDANGKILPFARNRKDRNLQPSDHRPVRVDLDFQEILSMP